MAVVMVCHHTTPGLILFLMRCHFLGGKKWTSVRISNNFQKPEKNQVLSFTVWQYPSFSKKPFEIMIINNNNMVKHYNLHLYHTWYSHKWTTWTFTFLSMLVWFFYFLFFSYFKRINCMKTAYGHLVVMIIDFYWIIRRLF